MIPQNQIYIDESSDPGVLLTKIALAKQDGGIVVFQTPKDIYVTAVDERVTYQQVNNVVNNPAGNTVGEIQFSDNGKFGADGDFRYDSNTDILTLNGSLATGNIVVAKRSDLGAVGNVRITGGTSGQFLQTDGAGVLSWQTSSATLPIENGTSQINIPLTDGQITITANGDRMWAFNTAGYLVTPNISIGAGRNEQSQIASQRKIIPGGRSSATVLSSNTPTVVYTVSSIAIVAFKTVLSVQHANGEFEFIDITASRSGADVGFTVTNRIAPSSLPSTLVFVDLDFAGRLQITLTTQTAPSGAAWVTYDATEFGRPTA